MSERIWGALRKNALYKSTYTLLLIYVSQLPYLRQSCWSRVTQGTWWQASVRTYVCVCVTLPMRVLRRTAGGDEARRIVLSGRAEWDDRGETVRCRTWSRSTETRVCTVQGLTCLSCCALLLAGIFSCWESWEDWTFTQRKVHQPVQQHVLQCGGVSWSLTSPFSTNMAISETKVQGWRAIPTQWRKANDILTSTLAAFSFSSHPKGKGIERLI